MPTKTLQLREKCCRRFNKTIVTNKNEHIYKIYEEENEESVAWWFACQA